MTSYTVSDGVMSSAIISDDGLYRYSLLRAWSTENSTRVMWVMLNPSTADARQNDPTIRRCMAFSKAWGYGGLIVVNLYAFRATKPAAMWAARQAGVDIIGPECDGWIRAHAETNAALVVGAWGAGAEHGRVWRVTQTLRGYPITALATTKAGMPRHPLYLRGEVTPQPWTLPDPA